MLFLLNNYWSSAGIWQEEAGLFEWSEGGNLKALEEVKGPWAEKAKPKAYTPLIEARFEYIGYA